MHGSDKSQKCTSDFSIKMHDILVQAKNFTKSQPCSAAPTDATNCHSPTILPESQNSGYEVYSVFHLKHNPNTSMHKRRNQGNIEFLQLYRAVVADAHVTQTQPMS
jgi:hypothetical protein